MKAFSLSHIAAALAGAVVLAAPLTAGAATSTDAFNVTIKITGTCAAVTANSGQPGAITTDTPTLAGADISFGSYTAAATYGAIDGANMGGATTGIAVRCSRNTPFIVSLTPSNANTAGAGSMSGITTGNTDTVAYQLYQPTITGTGLAATISNTKSTNVWGNTSGNWLSFTGKGMGTPNTVQLPVFGQVPANSIDKFVDRYQDRVTVTLTY